MDDETYYLDRILWKREKSIVEDPQNNVIEITSNNAHTRDHVPPDPKLASHIGPFLRDYHSREEHERCHAREEHLFRWNRGRKMSSISMSATLTEEGSMEKKGCRGCGV